MGQLLNRRSFEYDTIEIANKKYDSAVADDLEGEKRVVQAVQLKPEVEFPYSGLRSNDWKTMKMLEAIPRLISYNSFPRIVLNKEYTYGRKDVFPTVESTFSDVYGILTEYHKCQEYKDNFTGRYSSDWFLRDIDKNHLYRYQNILYCPCDLTINYYVSVEKEQKDFWKAEPDRKYVDVRLFCFADEVASISEVKLYNESLEELPNNAIGYSFVFNQLIIPMKRLGASLGIPLSLIPYCTSFFRIYFPNDTTTLPVHVCLKMKVVMWSNTLRTRFIGDVGNSFWKKNLYAYAGSIVVRIKNLPPIPSEKVIEKVGNEIMITLDHCDMESLKVEPSGVEVLLNGETHCNSYILKFADPWVKTLKITTVDKKPFHRISYREVARDDVFYGEFV